LAHEVVPDDSVVRFAGEHAHKDSIYSVAFFPKEPYNTFISGDCDDKALVWKVIKDDSPVGEEEKKEGEDQSRMRVKSVFHKSLPGHTETVEFIKFNHDAKLMATAGMNNQIRIWNTENDFSLKCALEDGPSEDLNFLEWHPKGNVLITGGKDLLIWMFNGQNG
jgi:WD40 repeat protein